MSVVTLQLGQCGTQVQHLLCSINILLTQQQHVVDLQIGHALFDTLARETDLDQASSRSPLFDVFFRPPAEQRAVTKKRFAFRFPQSKFSFCMHYFDSSRQIYRRHARAVLVDMEPKVVNRALVSAASSGANWCYAPGCCFSQQSGSGNNWARGYNSYGPTFASNVCELVRREVRLCPSV